MSDVEAEVDESGKGLRIRMVLVVLAGAALALFVVQNTEDARVQFLWMEGSIPLSLLLVITVALTLVLAAAGTWLLRRRS